MLMFPGTSQCITLEFGLLQGSVKPAITGVIAHDNQKTTYYTCTPRVFD